MKGMYKMVWTETTIVKRRQPIATGQIYNSFHNSERQDHLAGQEKWLTVNLNVCDILTNLYFFNVTYFDITMERISLICKRNKNSNTVIFSPYKTFEISSFEYH